MSIQRIFSLISFVQTHSTIFKNKIYLGYIAAFLSSALCGLLPTIAKPTTETIHPLLLAGTISLITAAVVTPFSPRKTILPKRKFLLIGIVSVVGAILAPSFYFIGLESTSASNTVLFNNSEIIFTVLLAIAFFKERVGKLGIFAISIVLIAALVVVIDFDFSVFVTDFHNYGSIMVLLAMVFWAIDSNISRSILKDLNVIRLLQLKSVIGGSILFTTVFAFGLANNWIDLIDDAVLLTGVVGFAIPWLFFYYALKQIGTVKTILIYGMSPIFGIIFASIFLNEQIEAQHILAAFVMIAGVFLLHKDKKHVIH